MYYCGLILLVGVIFTIIGFFIVLLSSALIGNMFTLLGLLLVIFYWIMTGLGLNKDLY